MEEGLSVKLAIGCDEAAYRLKKVIMDHLDEKGIEYQDFGAAEGETVLYPAVFLHQPECLFEGGMQGFLHVVRHMIFRKFF